MCQYDPDRTLSGIAALVRAILKGVTRGSTRVPTCEQTRGGEFPHFQSLFHVCIFLVSKMHIDQSKFLT